MKINNEESDRFVITLPNEEEFELVLKEGKWHTYNMRSCAHKEFSTSVDALASLLKAAGCNIEVELESFES